MTPIALTPEGDEIQCQIVARAHDGRAVYCALAIGEPAPPIDARVGADPNDPYDPGELRWAGSMAAALDAWLLID